MFTVWRGDCLIVSVIELKQTFSAMFRLLLCVPLLTMHAQQAAVPPPAVATPLTLQDAIAMAQRNSPVLHEAQARTARAAGALQTSKAYTNPTLEVFEGRQYARPIATPGVPGLLQHYAASQTIEIPSERRARQHVAGSVLSSNKLEEEVLGLSLAGHVKRAFYEVLRRREEIDHANENLALVQDLRQRVEVEVRVGEKGRLELTRAEAERARAQFAVRSARLQYADAIAVLRATIAAPPQMTLDPQGTLDASRKLPPIEQARAQVLQVHPLVAQSQAELDAANAQVQRERALRIPQPSAFAEYENQPDLRFWRAGVTVSLPLWDRRRGQVNEARADVARQTAVADQRRIDLNASLERAYERYQLADEQVVSLEAGALHEAESAVEAAKAAYRFGERGIVEVLDAQRVLQSVRGDLLDAQFARQNAAIDLEELGVKP